jgi:hypothetical protein
MQQKLLPFLQQKQKVLKVFSFSFFTHFICPAKNKC